MKVTSKGTFVNQEIIEKIFPSSGFREGLESVDADALLGKNLPA